MFKTIVRNLLITIGVVGTLIGGTAAVASAHTVKFPKQVVSVTVDNGHYFTNDVLWVGETLKEFGYGTETVTVTSLAPLTFSAPLVNDTVPHQGSLVIDLKATA